MREGFAVLHAHYLMTADAQMLPGEQRQPIEATISEHKWAERGSKRYINDPESLKAAILYVRDAQYHDH